MVFDLARCRVFRAVGGGLNGAKKNESRYRVGGVGEPCIMRWVSLIVGPVQGGRQSRGYQKPFGILFISVPVSLLDDQRACMGTKSPPDLHLNGAFVPASDERCFAR